MNDLVWYCNVQTPEGVVLLGPYEIKPCKLTLLIDFEEEWPYDFVECHHKLYEAELQEGDEC